MEQNGRPRDGSIPDHESIRQPKEDFLVQLEQCTVKAECGREFVLVKRMRDWLSTAVTVDMPESTQFGRLVKDAWNKPGEPFNTREAINICGLTFCILYQLDQGHLIGWFRRGQIIDSTLSMSPNELLNKIKTALEHEGEDCDPQLLFHRVEKLRWRFISPVFELEMDQEYNEKDYVFPILRRELITDKGGTATLWKIVVPEEYVGESLREKVKTSLRETEDGMCFHFALKAFNEGNKQRFLNEKSAFETLHGHDGMVGYLGNFDRTEQKRLIEINTPDDSRKSVELPEKSHNILLQFGSCDLDEYFIQNFPPLFEKDLDEFWGDLVEIVDGVKKIHRFEDPSIYAHETYKGLHSDLKPANILLVDNKFKLADPGFMRFYTETGHEAIKGYAEGGTWTYGAPEWHVSRYQVTQNVDIWSLGCVFSIAATWVVTGLKGVVNYMKIREDAIRKLHKEGMFKGEVGEVGDLFHDGKQVLRAVTEWHNILRQSVRRADRITGKILDLIDKEMFLSDPSERASASKLCTELNHILKNARNDKPQIVSQDILDSLSAVDEFSIPGVTEFVNLLSGKNFPTSLQERQARKSNVYQAFAGLIMQQNAASRERRGVDVNKKKPTSPEDIQAVSQNTGSKEATQVQIRTGTNSSVITNTSRQNNGRWSVSGYSPSSPQARQRLKASAHIPKDIFQVREDQERRSRLRVTSLLKSITSGPNTKYNVLADLFRERDIVFVMDNAGTMETWWAKAKFALKVLVTEVLKLDDVHMDLAFTSGHNGLQDGKKEEEFIKVMSSNTTYPKLGRETDMDQALGDIFERRVRQMKLNRRALTFIIFTDGIWGLTVDKTTVKDRIAKFVADVNKALDTYRKRPVSIEFVRFGNDLTSRIFLQQLDDKLSQEKNIPDVIDTESADGDVFKMLLGSFVEAIDAIEPEDWESGGIISPSSIVE